MADVVKRFVARQTGWENMDEESEGERHFTHGSSWLTVKLTDVHVCICVNINRLLWKEHHAHSANPTWMFQSSNCIMFLEEL